MKKESITRRKFLQRSGLAAAGVAVAPLAMGCNHRGIGDDPSDKGNRELPLFTFDERSIPWTKNLKLTMTQPEKYPENPVVRRGPKGSVDHWAVQFYGSVIRHDEKFKMWYIAGTEKSLQMILNGKGDAGLRVAYAESQDGIHWHKPNLGLVEFNGNKQNNLVKMEPQQVGGIHVIVIHEPEGPHPDHRFKMMLCIPGEMNKNGKTRSTSIPLFSPDGLHWKCATKVHFNKNNDLIHSDVILPFHSYEQSGLFKRSGIYYLTGQVFSPATWQPSGKRTGRSMAVIRSRNLIDWETAESYSFARYGTRSKTPPPDGEGEQAHLCAAIWDRGETLFGVYGMWHGSKKWKNRSMDLGFLVSQDGVYFREPIPNHTFIRRGEDGEWDQGGLIQGQGFFNRGDKTWIYYGSWDMRKPNYPPRGGVGLATMRRDGFGYLSAKRTDQPAHFITRRISKGEIPSGKLKIAINVEGVSGKAPLQVEILDKFLEPVAKYAGKNAGLVEEEGVGQEVTWPSAKRGKAIDANGDFSVKVTYPNSNSTPKVYALYLTNLH